MEHSSVQTHTTKCIIMSGGTTNHLPIKWPTSYLSGMISDWLRSEAWISAGFSNWLGLILPLYNSTITWHNKVCHILTWLCLDTLCLDTVGIEMVPLDMISLDIVPLETVPLDMVCLDTVPHDMVPLDMIRLDMVHIDKISLDTRSQHTSGHGTSW